MVDHQHSAEGILRFCNEYLEAPNIVCIDEVGFYVGDHGKYGYSQIGITGHCRQNPPALEVLCYYGYIAKWYYRI